MSDATRSILHEVMEQQTVSIAKAGIVASLNARTSILASANPKESRYNPNLSVPKNIALGPTLLSRFDLIYLVLDQPNKHTDAKLARHLVAMYGKDYEFVEQKMIPLETVTRFVSFARRTVHPEITDQSGKLLVDAYVEMRKVGGSKVITATPRQLESLIRLSEALARMRLSALVEQEDVKEACRLMRVATLSAATDPKTGKIDMNLITTGQGVAERGMLDSLKESILETLESKKRATVAALTTQLNETLDASLRVTRDTVRDACEELRQEGSLSFQARGELYQILGR